MMAMRKQLPEVVPLDPDKFMKAWANAMTAVEADNIVPIEVARSVLLDLGEKEGNLKNVEVRFKNNPHLRMVASLRGSFKDEGELYGVAAVMRAQALLSLASQRRLGPFAREDAIHEAVIRAAAEAKWDWKKQGFVFDDLRRRTIRNNKKMSAEG